MAIKRKRFGTFNQCMSVLPTGSNFEEDPDSSFEADPLSGPTGMRRKTWSDTDDGFFD